MRHFKTAQRDWAIEVNIPQRAFVRDGTDHKIDLFAVFDGTLQAQLADPETLGTTIYLLCQKQAEAAGVTPEQFAYSLQGEVIDEASIALMQAIMDFFPNRQRQILDKALAKGREMVQQATDALMQELDKPIPQWKSKSDSLNLQEPLESIPAV